MKNFIHDDFLLQSDFAKRLYHDYAKDLPIIDYHNHLPPQEIAENKVFGNISEVWLAGDHYKWRAMRALGINEKYITGNATDREKFVSWANTVPYTVRNPLYHWTHLELKRYFGVTDLLGPENAGAIFDLTAAKFGEESHSTLGLLQQQNVESLCTTDEPIASLEYHKRIKAQGTSPKVFPTFRPDKAFAIEGGKDYMAYIDLLSEASGLSIDSYEDLLSVLENRIDYFHGNGCRLADHGLEQLYCYEEGAFSSKDIF